MWGGGCARRAGALARQARGEVIPHSFTVGSRKTMLQMHRRKTKTDEFGKPLPEEPQKALGKYSAEERTEVARRAASAPLAVREKKVEAPTQSVEPHPYDPAAAAIESEPHAWEKVIQEGKGVPADEFGRKMFLFDAVRPDPNTNLFVQIIVDALEEACAEDIAVVDVTQKHTFFPSMYEWLELSSGQSQVQRKLDMIVFASGKTARHIATIADAVADRGRRGLIPCEVSRRALDVNENKDEVFWHAKLPCGKIMVDISTRNRRDYRMVERKTVLARTDDAAALMEDFLTDDGWVRSWDFWSPNAPCIPAADFESVYGSERSHGWERADVLKSEYIITDEDIRRRFCSGKPELEEVFRSQYTPEDFEKPYAPQFWDVMKQHVARIKYPTRPSMEIAGIEPRMSGVSGNVEFRTGDPPAPTDEEVEEFIEKYRRRFLENQIMVEPPHLKEEKDRLWAEYERRRDARIMRYGYYDYVELSNDLHRGRVLTEDGPVLWNALQEPAPEVALAVSPHPENYKGTPRDTTWGPGWYDV